MKKHLIRLGIGILPIAAAVGVGGMAILAVNYPWIGITVGVLTLAYVIGALGE